MYLRISPDAPVTVHEADDCGRLHVTLDGATEEQADTALRSAALGRIDGPDEAWLDLAGLRALAEGAATADDWAAQWDKMIAYARSKGWATPDGTEVQAHIERA